MSSCGMCGGGHGWLVANKLTFGAPKVVIIIIIIIVPRGTSHHGRRSRRPSVSNNRIARNQEFGLSTLHTKAKVQRPSQSKIITI